MSAARAGRVQRVGVAAVPVVGAAAFLAVAGGLDAPRLVVGAVLVAVTFASFGVTTVVSAGLPLWWRVSGLPVMAWFVATLLWQAAPILTAAGLDPMVSGVEHRQLSAAAAVVWLLWLVSVAAAWFAAVVRGGGKGPR